MTTAEKIYKVDWTSKALKELTKLGNYELAVQLRKQTDEILSKNPYHFDNKNIRLLTGEWKGFWRLRISDYRIIYKVFEYKVLVEVFKVGHRGDVYE